MNPIFSAADHTHMAQALQWAERGQYHAAPNPHVGCVIVRDGVVIGQGCTQPVGGPHAEIEALHMCGDARGADVYLTLEPCCHTGRTPPCSTALIAAGVRRVVAAMRDPNPQVDGGGFAALQQAGIMVESGLMAAQAREINLGFFSRMERGRPWVRCKIAASLDGATALGNGLSQWITGEDARRDGQHWRACASAILTGAGTVRADNPRLTVRHIDTPRQPLRVVVDSQLQTPSDAAILPALIACTAAHPARAAALRAAGADIVVLPADATGRVSLPALLSTLAQREINLIHVEAGTTLNSALLQENLVDEWLFYLAPTLLGGGTHPMFSAPEISTLQQRRELALHSVVRIGQDIRIRARPR